MLEAGYLLHDRLLRPAMVAVAKADSPIEPAANGSDSSDGNS
ncbi:MAG: nucleotide exchange factor GrpE [Dongiaceae bacterium]